MICAGEALWDLTAPPGVPFEQAGALGLRAGGGALNAATVIARAGLRVGLAATVGDDALGRALAARAAAAGLDTGGVGYTPARTGLVLIEPAISGARRVVAYRTDDEAPPRVPAEWRARVALISGLAPHRAHTAGLRAIAAATREAGAAVVVDVNARRRLWAGRAALPARAVVREADVVRCSAEDLAVLRVSAGELASWTREGAALVITDGAGPARASGPFGEITAAPEALIARDPTGAGDTFTAAIVVAIARSPAADRAQATFWERAITGAHAAAGEHLRARA